MNVDGTGPEKLVGSFDEPGAAIGVVRLEDRAVLHRDDSSPITAESKREGEEATRREDGAVQPGARRRIREPPRMPEDGPATRESELSEWHISPNESLCKCPGASDDQDLGVDP